MSTKYFRLTNNKNYKYVIKQTDPPPITLLKDFNEHIPEETSKRSKSSFKLKSTEAHVDNKKKKNNKNQNIRTKEAP